MVFRSLLRRALFRAADDEHLAHLFRKRHFCKDRIHRVSLPEQRLLPPGILRSAAQRTGSALHGRAARLCHRAHHIPQYAAARCRAQRDQQQRNAAARGKAALFSAGSQAALLLPAVSFPAGPFDSPIIAVPH